MTTVLAIGGFAVLFAIFGLMAPGEAGGGCGGGSCGGGDCASCPHDDEGNGGWSWKDDRSSTDRASGALNDE